jgi:hypothetical protein
MKTIQCLDYGSKEDDKQKLNPSVERMILSWVKRIFTIQGHLF